MTSLAGLMRIASRAICLVVVAWFVVFVVDQTGAASVPAAGASASTGAATGAAEGATGAPQPKSTPRRVLDEVAEALTAPFSAAVADSHSEWVIHAVKTLLALLIYGFGVGLLARFVSIRT